MRETITRHPATAAVFARHGLERCCGGVHSIAMTARARGVPLDPLLDQLNEAAEVPMERTEARPVAVPKAARAALYAAWGLLAATMIAFSLLGLIWTVAGLRLYLR